ncbi:hypothetical protein RD110_11455 [Rhodoferax koreense]|uniref:Uncharacterized protein n=1 Tax=Rhodoferax koreensis TaxID=1842727 RepID=A0A1P8JVH7_9BURK|nr:hypothetical protein RD110_11455 [Rhodoferax koreense]
MGRPAPFPPFVLSLSKDLLRRHGFDRLSPNGEGVGRPAPFPPFVLSLSKDLLRRRGFDELSPNGYLAIN